MRRSHPSRRAVLSWKRRSSSCSFLLIQRMRRTSSSRSVLLQVALHTQMETEQGAFTFGDVCTGICKKLIARHPHIFAQAGASNRTADEVLDTWEQIKRKEKHREGLAQDLESVPRSLPALMRAQKVAKRAAGHGVCRSDTNAALQALAECVAALQAAAADTADTHDASANKADTDERRRLLGEVLFAAADASRFLGCDAEEVLDEETGRFIERFTHPGEGAGIGGFGPD